MDIDRIVDQFVDHVNQDQSRREPKQPEDVPAALRRGDPNQFGFYDWKIQPTETIGWIAPFEARLPARLPPAYRSLITRYCYPAFDLGPIRLFANTGTNVPDELVEAGFKDKALYPTLLKHGYLQLGRPGTGSYDPVCFDASRRTNQGDMPIVQIDHEAVLMYGRITVTSNVAMSFLDLIQTTLER